MESNNQFKIDLIRIDNTEYVRDIVTVNESLYHKTIMSVHEDYSEQILKLTKVITKQPDDIVELDVTREGIIKQHLRIREDSDTY